MKRALALVLVALAACSSEEASTPAPDTAKSTVPPAPPAAEIRELIANSAELGEFEFTNAAFTTPVTGTTMSAPVRESAKELAAAGWISFDGAGDISLTDKARNDKRFLLRANGILDVVPLAKKEMGEVTAVRPNPDHTLTADFTWRWVANEVGAVFKSGALQERFATPRNSHATLIWDGTQWSVLSIE